MSIHKTALINSYKKSDITKTIYFYEHSKLVAKLTLIIVLKQSWNSTYLPHASPLTRKKKELFSVTYKHELYYSYTRISHHRPTVRVQSWIRTHCKLTAEQTSDGHWWKIVVRLFKITSGSPSMRKRSRYVDGVNRGADRWIYCVRYNIQARDNSVNRE